MQATVLTGATLRAANTPLADDINILAWLLPLGSSATDLRRAQKREAAFAPIGGAVLLPAQNPANPKPTQTAVATASLPEAFAVLEGKVPDDLCCNLLVPGVWSSQVVEFWRCVGLLTAGTGDAVGGASRDRDSQYVALRVPQDLSLPRSAAG